MYVCVYVCHRNFKTRIWRFPDRIGRWNFAWKQYEPLKKEEYLKTEDDIKNEDDLKNKDNLKNQDRTLPKITQP